MFTEMNMHAWCAHLAVVCPHFLTRTNLLHAPAFFLDEFFDQTTMRAILNEAQQERLTLPCAPGRAASGHPRLRDNDEQLDRGSFEFDENSCRMDCIVFVFGEVDLGRRKLPATPIPRA